MRIAHFLARCGIASRRKAEEIVRAGRVTVNGETILNLAHQIDTGADEVRVDDRALEFRAEHLTLLMNKPEEVMVTRNDTHGRKTVYDLLPKDFARREAELVYAGRLDFRTSGLLVMTTDGELANRLTHPRHHITKVYEVRINRELTDAELTALRAGIDIGDGETQPCEVSPLRKDPATIWYEITLKEGRNRQVRRMIEAVGAEVLYLQRTALGGLMLRKLPLAKGRCMELDEKLIAQLFGEEQL